MYEKTVTIDLMRYDALLQAEQDATALKMLIWRRHKEYAGIKYDEVRTLHQLYNDWSKEE